MPAGDASGQSETASKVNFAAEASGWAADPAAPHQSSGHLTLTTVPLALPWLC